jgi:NAD(P)-dependent dehydrogenase (short-subunit alcohol dehydrogenase family)
MELKDQVVIVTGGASGIGRELCRAFAAQGARGVTVADIDEAGAARVAGELALDADQTLAVPVDVADERQVRTVVQRTEEAFAPVDLFCANAGILIGGGVEVPDAEWKRIWSVNVLSHIYAARAVLPGMIERGKGYLLHTASAAGLLTQLGSAPYSVTKHAVVALAEWLSITHAADGITVSCLCPQGVWTGMTGAPTDDSDPLLSATAGRNGMLMPEDVASTVLAGLADERFLILPHPEVATFEQRRAGDRERWLRAMRRIQAEITPA